MRASFPVEYISAPGTAWRAAVSVLVSASVAVPLAWALPYIALQGGGDPLSSPFARPESHGVLAAAFAVAAFITAWLWHRTSSASERTLRWDGQDWVLPAPAGGVELRGRASLMLDFGPWMLVGFRPHEGSAFGSRVWLPLALAGDPARWSALRAALWSCPESGRRHR
jgi:hypothetical protein